MGHQTLSQGDVNSFPSSCVVPLVACCVWGREYGLASVLVFTEIPSPLCESAVQGSTSRSHCTAGCVGNQVGVAPGQLTPLAPQAPHLVPFSCLGGRDASR